MTLVYRCSERLHPETCLRKLGIHRPPRRTWHEPDLRAEPALHLGRDLGGGIVHPVAHGVRVVLLHHHRLGVAQGGAHIAELVASERRDRPRAKNRRSYVVGWPTKSNFFNTNGERIRPT